MINTKENKLLKEESIPANNDCFIIMPIADHSDYKNGHFKRVYEDIFAPACKAAGYKPVRADDVNQANLIHLDILQKLLESPMAICDLSTRNPNVLFELGLRQAFDKPTILVQEVGTPKIFDINMFRYTEYRNGLDYRDVLADQKAIQKVLEETREAVKDGKSVNSIIKLLSITAPASLQDSSNFEDKEYFNILMSEISSLKELFYNSQSTALYKNNNRQLPKSSKTIPSTYYINIAKGTSVDKVQKFSEMLSNFFNLKNLRIINSQENKYSIVIDSLDEIHENSIFELAKVIEIIIEDIDDLPF